MPSTLAVTVENERTLVAGAILAGKYRIERVIGTGGMGVVVAAIHEQLDERVAIKLLKPERVADRDAAERVMREARAIVKIQSDHVVRVFDVGTLDDGVPYIVMEYLAGCDLAQLLCAEGKLPIADAASYVRQACDALAKAHAVGIVHRDLKPANLFLAVRDDVATIKVLDFGISKLITAEFDPALTSTQSILGSPTYMSPEQLDRPREVDARTDVWGLGVILYELVTGAHPFVGESFPQLSKRILEDPTPSVRALRGDAPEQLDAVIARCLAKQPDKRFAGVAELAEALAPLAGEDHAPPALARTMASAKTTGAGARPAGLTPAFETRGVRRHATLIAAGAALIAAGAILALALRSSDDPSASTPAAESKLASATSVLACPVLDARGVEAPTGWLGAATATIACTRAQAWMGGHSARTMIPAELLGLASMPVDRFPEDPFGAPDARAKTLAAAKLRGTAWLDGEVVHEPSREFRVTLALHEGQRVLAQGTGTNTMLPLAIRDAMAPILPRLPHVVDNDAFISDWFGVTSAAAAVAVADLAVLDRIGAEKPVVDAECTALFARHDLTRDGRRVYASVCGPPTSERVPPATNVSPSALRMAIEADPNAGARPLLPDLQQVDAALANTSDAEQRAMLFALKAQLLTSHHDVDGATQAALSGIHADPKALDVFESSWGVLAWLRATSSVAPASITWMPWLVEAYCFNATQTEDRDARVSYMRRNHTLSPHRVWTEALFEFLLADDRHEEALGVAAELGDDVALRVDIEASEARFGKAYELARTSLASFGRDRPYDAFYTAANGAMVGFVVGKPAPGVETLIANYLDPGTSTIGHEELAAFMASYACATASRELAATCFARLHTLYHGPIGFIDGLLDGEEKFAAGDYAGAALAWRPMLSKPGWQLDQLRDLIATAFERSGQDDLAARVDAPLLTKPGRWNGAELAYVREARRAEKRGDAAGAKQWANKVIAAWSVADIDVPAVAEMKALVARLH